MELFHETFISTNLTSELLQNVRMRLMLDTELYLLVSSSSISGHGYFLKVAFEP